MTAAQLELPTAVPAGDGAVLAFGAAVAALIPARPGARTPGAESVDRMRIRDRPAVSGTDEMCVGRPGWRSAMITRFDSPSSP